jgi:hypothetical protein
VFTPETLVDSRPLMLPGGTPNALARQEENP